MDAPRDRLDVNRLAIPALVVLVGVFSGMRLLGVDPWDMPAFDVYAYWATRDGFDYVTARQGDTGAYLYSPVFAQLIAPLVALPWPVFAGLWTVLMAAPLVWLAGRYAALLVLLPPVFLSIALGQLDLLFAAVAIVGLRWPVVWVLPILTKVTPGICLVWFAVRREWRSLWIALGATLATAAASAVADPGAWTAWVAMLARMEFPVLGGGLWFLPIPLVARLLFVAVLVGWGARRDRPWVIPVGVCLALPTVWLNSPTILIALLPLVAAGARVPAGAWLRSPAPASRRVAEPRWGSGSAGRLPRGPFGLARPVGPLVASPRVVVGVQRLLRRARFFRDVDEVDPHPVPER